MAGLQEMRAGTGGELLRREEAGMGGAVGGAESEGDGGGGDGASGGEGSAGETAEIPLPTAEATGTVAVPGEGGKGRCGHSWGGIGAKNLEL